jgi:outer membrane protein, multidrug efflux system
MSIQTFVRITGLLCLVFCFSISAVWPTPLHAFELPWKHYQRPKNPPSASPELNTLVEAHWKALNINANTTPGFTVEAVAPMAYKAPWVTAELKQLLQRGLKNNPQMALAKESLQQAKLLERVSFAGQLPKVNLEPSIVRQKFSENQFIFGNNFGSLPSFYTYTLPLTASYDVDLWGVNTRKTAIAREAIRLQELQLYAVEEDLILAMASTYLNTLETQEQLRLQLERLALLQSDVKRQEGLVKAGLSEIQILRDREALVDNAVLDLRLLEEKRAILENGLHLLVGESPTQAESFGFIGKLAALKPTETLLVDVPSNVVLQRPDVIAAERMMASKEIEVEIARRMILPQFRLSASVGLIAVHLRDWFSWESLAYNIAASAIQPLFAGGAIRAGYDLKTSEKAATLQYYHQTLVQAFTDVEDALVSLQRGAKQEGDFARARTTLEDKLVKETAKVRAGLLHPADAVPLKVSIVNLEVQQVRHRTERLVQELTVLASMGHAHDVL